MMGQDLLGEDLLGEELLPSQVRQALRCICAACNMKLNEKLLKQNLRTSARVARELRRTSAKKRSDCCVTTNRLSAVKKEAGPSTLVAHVLNVYATHV